MAKFWQGLNKASSVDLLDKVMVGKNADGSTAYADINQIRLLVAAFTNGQIIPSRVAAGTNLGAPADPAIKYAGAGTYGTPSGNLVLTENLNMLFWDKAVWSSLPIPITVPNNAKIQTWLAQPYVAEDQVNHGGKDWVAATPTTATDIPGESPKWKERLTYLPEEDFTRNIYNAGSGGLYFVDSEGNINLQVLNDGTIEVIDMIMRALSVKEKIGASSMGIGAGNEIYENNDNDFIIHDTEGFVLLRVKDGKLHTERLGIGGENEIIENENYDLVIHDDEGFIQFAIKDGKILGLSSDGENTSSFNSPTINSDMEWQSIYGQSLSLAANSEEPIHTTPIPHLFMFEGGINSLSAANTATRTNSIVPLREGLHAGTTRNGETNGFSFGATYLEFLAKENNFIPGGSKPYDILISADGHGGLSVAYLSKGTTPYTRWLQSLQAAVARGNELGKTVKVLTLVWVHGEEDIEIHTPKEVYKTGVIQLYNDMVADIKAATGQSEDPIFVMSQPACHNHFGMYPEIAIAQIELCMEQPNFELGSCLYHFDYQAHDTTGTPNANVHLVRDSYMKMASDLAYTAKQRNVDGLSKRFIYPREIFKQGNIIEIKFNKNHGDLVFDTETVVNPGNYGFTLRTVSGTGGTVIPLTSVEIVRGDTVKIVASQPIVSGNSLTYGQNGSTARDGRLVGARGCLRDQTGDVAKRFIYGTEEYRLDKWCPIFEKIF